MRVRPMALVFGALLLTAAVGAQAPPRFEVASVKPSPPGAQPNPARGGRMELDPVPTGIAVWAQGKPHFGLFR